MITQPLVCRESFLPRQEASQRPFTGELARNAYFAVQAEVLDHGIPSLAFRFEEQDRWNIKKNVLEEMQLPKGRWLMDLKEQAQAGRDPDFPIRIYWRDEERQVRERWLPLGELMATLMVLKKGQKLAYVTDTAGTQANRQKILNLALEVDLLYIEAPFLWQDLAVARNKAHLTAVQAGVLAREASVKKLQVFHFSPKYKGNYDLLEKEAKEAWQEGRPTLPEEMWLPKG
jgi:ribonuclease Z